MKNLEDYIASLTPEELELHKDLIEECVAREKTIDKAGRVMRDKLPKLFAVTEKMINNLSEISKSTQQLHENAKALKERQDNKLLVEIPDEEFFVA